MTSGRGTTGNMMEEMDKRDLKTNEGKALKSSKMEIQANYSNVFQVKR